ncbi:hypothetical protein GGC64_006274 [Mycobacterium sp. OAS707]|uniref:hypothetical protein n=1 Tax=Mycobacterium sp. OAS707 TaxID=2663822 RepID=UPI001789C76F|nr:hypothetical protein [Mycobacterium sp. OAS707]MBE1552187.1 hypothetical protein [Mycobacterium sp. OAS707]
MSTDRPGADDVGGPDNTLSPSESLDSDDVRNDDGDVVVEPPDTWLDPGDDESLEQRLAAEQPEITADTPHSALPLPAEGVASCAEAIKESDIVDGVIVEDSRIHRGQVDGAPEDGDSFFPIGH